MADEEQLTLLQKEGVRINRAKDIREALADELADILTKDEADHLRTGDMQPVLGALLAMVRLTRGKK